MKLKIDFVTNSSSSSFLVAFSTPIAFIKDLDMLDISRDMTERVFNDSVKQSPILIDDSIKLLKIVTERVSSGSFNGRPTYDYYNNKIAEEHGVSKYDLWKTHRELAEKADKMQRRATAKAAKNVAERFIKNNKGKYLYSFSYGDENGELESRLEHSGTFRNVSYLRISHH